MRIAESGSLYGLFTRVYGHDRLASPVDAQCDTANMHPTNHGPPTAHPRSSHHLYIPAFIFHSFPLFLYSHDLYELPQLRLPALH